MPPLDAAPGDGWVTVPAAHVAPAATSGNDGWVTVPTPPAQHWGAPTGGEFGDLDAQSKAPAAPQGQVGADLNAVGQGLVSGTGAAIVGAGRIAQAGSGPSAQRVLAALDLVDEGKNRDAYQKLSDAERQQVGAYRGSRPEDKQAQRDALQQSIADYDKPNALTQAGMAVEGAAPTMFPVAPENEGIQTGVGRMIGGAAPALAAGAVGGPVGILASLATIGSQAYDGAYQDAVSKGATHEDADDAAGKSALAQAATMVAPVGRLLQRVPMPVRDGLTATLVNLGQHGIEFGSANALGTFANNYVASQTYDPSRSLAQGTGNAALEGAIAGLIIPAAASAVRGARPPAATIDDIAKAPDIDSAISAAGEAARAPSDTQIERLNWGDLFTPKSLDGAANDIYPNPRARTQTAIDTPAFMPPGSQVPAGVIEATRPDFIPPAPPVAPEITPGADQPPPLTQVTRQGTTVPGTSILNSNRVNSPTRAANDVNPLLPPPANDAEAYPAWNASRAQQAAQESTPAPTPQPTTPTPADSITTPNQTVPGGPRQPASAQSVGAAASRDMANPDSIEMSTSDMKANRRRAEMDEILATPKENDTTIYVNGSFPTLAERSGDPLVSQYENLLRQRNPGEFIGEGKRLTENNKARVNEYDNNTIPDTTLNTMRKDRAARFIAASDDILPNAKPADLTPAMDWVEEQLSNPRLQENDAVRSVLENFRDRLVDDGGNLKSDPAAVWGIHDNLQNQLAKAKDPLNMTGSEKFAEAQIIAAKALIDKAMNVATGNRFQSALDGYAQDSRAINSGVLLNDFRPKLTNMSGELQAASFHRFVTNLAKERGDPGIDPSMDISDETMRSLINIDADLKRAGLIRLGAAAGSPTNLLGALAEKAGLDTAHKLASAIPGANTLLSPGLKFLAQRKLESDTAKHLAPPEGGYRFPRDIP